MNITISLDLITDNNSNIISDNNHKTKHGNLLEY